MTQGHEVDALLQSMADDLLQLLQANHIHDPLMIGIHTGGVWVAQALLERLPKNIPLGTLNISFYRDDFTRIGMHPQVEPSQLDFNIENRHIILVDDVLHTGRTIRAALNEIFDYGRPASVSLAVLVQRSGQELPICADVRGMHMDLLPDEHVKLSGPDPLSLQVQTQKEKTGT
ncbi:Pyrimidine operon regulatory protein PyrR [hydrothermal vent metagenome]|uniref:Pyrimidine operon regulatory protein PyrR n=1 Tax=hydrothermal vent metagenome TaxID=652676 RepID=A0A3B1BCR5_9ZZZZ